MCGAGALVGGLARARRISYSAFMRSDAFNPHDSLRYAFVKVCMQHIDQASGWEKMSPEAPNAMPAKAFFHEVAGIFDSAFADIVAVSPGMLPEIEDIDHLAQSVTASLASSLSPAALDVLVEFEVGNELLSAFSLEACRHSAHAYGRSTLIIVPVAWAPKQKALCQRVPFIGSPPGPPIPPSGPLGVGFRRI